jgi:hypothetical protein
MNPYKIHGADQPSGSDVIFGRDNIFVPHGIKTKKAKALKSFRLLGS